MPDFDLSLWDDEFMKPEILRDHHILSVQTTSGIEVIPCDTLGLPDPPCSDCCEEEFEDFKQKVYPHITGGVEDPEDLFEPREGFVVRLRAPGYMDRTDWEYCENEDDVRSWLKVQSDMLDNPVRRFCVRTTSGYAEEVARQIKLKDPGAEVEQGNPATFWVSTLLSSDRVGEIDCVEDVIIATYGKPNPEEE